MKAAGALRRAVFLDRDGVINAMVYDTEHGLIDSPQNPDQFQLLPNVGEAVRLINEMGLLAVVVSNQPGVAKGKSTMALLESTTARMERELAESGARLDGVYYCLHHPEATLEQYRGICSCRKPKSGLLRQATEAIGIDLDRSFMVGDGLTDIQAGRSVGCTTVLLGTLRCDSCHLMSDQNAFPDLLAPDLLSAVRLIQSRLGQP